MDNHTETFILNIPITMWSFSKMALTKYPQIQTCLFVRVSVNSC